MPSNNGKGDGQHSYNQENHSVMATSETINGSYS